ncbi:MAG: hypothetical protein HY774_11345 [Acidobacteria bacterium]|nr:hypothetical protein [Acidobacteriota bacterium]
MNLTTPARRAMESSWWAACFEAHPPEEGKPRIVCARMGAGSIPQRLRNFHWNLAIDPFQRPSGRERDGHGSGGMPKAANHRLLSVAHPGGARPFRNGVNC